MLKPEELAIQRILPDRGIVLHREATDALLTLENAEANLGRVAPAYFAARETWVDVDEGRSVPLDVSAPLLKERHDRLHRQWRNLQGNVVGPARLAVAEAMTTEPGVTANEAAAVIQGVFHADPTERQPYASSIANALDHLQGSLAADTPIAVHKIEQAGHRYSGFFRTGKDGIAVRVDRGRQGSDTPAIIVSSSGSAKGMVVDDMFSQGRFHISEKTLLNGVVLSGRKNDTVDPPAELQRLARSGENSRVKLLGQNVTPYEINTRNRGEAIAQLLAATDVGVDAVIVPPLTARHGRIIATAVKDSLVRRVIKGEPEPGDPSSGAYIGNDNASVLAVDATYERYGRLRHLADYAGVTRGVMGNLIYHQLQIMPNTHVGDGPIDQVLDKLF